MAQTPTPPVIQQQYSTTMEFFLSQRVTELENELLATKVNASVLLDYYQKQLELTKKQLDDAALIGTILERRSILADPTAVPAYARIESVHTTFVVARLVQLSPVGQWIDAKPESFQLNIASDKDGSQLFVPITTQRFRFVWKKYYRS